MSVTGSTCPQVPIQIHILIIGLFDVTKFSVYGLQQPSQVGFRRDAVKLIIGGSVDGVILFRVHLSVELDHRLLCSSQVLRRTAAGKQQTRGEHN